MLHPMVRRAAILIAVAAIAAASWATPAGALSLWPTCPSPPGGDYALCTRGAFPQSVLPGPDGAVWFTTARANLGRATAAGGISQFDVPLGAAGTPFQQRVWKELGRIPFGTTITYAELARRVGEPTASRAVGDRKSVV